jgi:competence protein ComEA
MFKKLLAFFAAMYMAVSFAAVDVNKANAAELDGLKGIGPAISGRIIDERKKGNFKDWNDFIERVKGVGEGNAAKFSAEGLTVGGAGFKGATAKPSAAVKKDEKTVAAVAPAAKAADVTAPAASASAAKEVKKNAKAEAKAEAKAKKEADAKAKAEEKKKKTDEAKAKADAKKVEQSKPMVKDDAKADAAKPAASAVKK